MYHQKVALAPGSFGKVVASTLNVRSGAGISKPLVTTAPAGTILAITGGPVSADGYSWYEVSLPIKEWAPVVGVRTNVWVASSSSSTTLVAAVGAPNSTGVDLPAAVAPAAGARFIGINPARLLDTRVGVGLSGPFSSGAARTFPVAAAVAVECRAVTGTLTVVGQKDRATSASARRRDCRRSSVVNARSEDVRESGSRNWGGRFAGRMGGRRRIQGSIISTPAATSDWVDRRQVCAADASRVLDSRTGAAGRRFTSGARGRSRSADAVAFRPAPLR